MATAPETPGAGEGENPGAGTVNEREVEVLARAAWESEGRLAADWNTADAKVRALYRRVARSVLATGRWQEDT
jgi:hypothetical protein